MFLKFLKLRQSCLDAPFWFASLYLKTKSEYCVLDLLRVCFSKDGFRVLFYIASQNLHVGKTCFSSLMTESLLVERFNMRTKTRLTLKPQSWYKLFSPLRCFLRVSKIC